ncbi:hypothetical protein [Desulfopila inferna]|uniref:hypothetical protein n=1 Tax=Desulfopila inferna TaxID=468528 RepID=UPI001966C771|nr:hypothetical protein [Desulfopila inferna]MBM9605254.1 hypothetical protein [Desulfopila inferna]
MKEISSLLQESTGDVQLIYSAVEQLTGTVSEISETSGKAHLNTTNARKKMELLEEDVHKQGAASLRG